MIQNYLPSIAGVLLLILGLVLGVFRARRQNHKDWMLNYSSGNVPEGPRMYVKWSLYGLGFLATLLVLALFVST